MHYDIKTKIDVAVSFSLIELKCFLILGILCKLPN